MQLIHFYCMGRRQWGEVLGGQEGIRVLSGTPWEGELSDTGHVLSFDAIHPLPACRPSKIVCVGSNYRRHCEEMGRPIPEVPKLFIKPPSALLADGGVIELPPGVGRVDFEGELAVVIGRRARRIKAGEAANYVLGSTILNDVTARDIQRADVQFTRAKGFDTFCPLGPWIETDVDPSDLALSTTVNGTVKQDSRTSDMIFGPMALVSFVSHVMTLEPGDVISTGTPSGVGKLEEGDEVAITIEGIGTLTNPVVRG